MKLAFIVTQRDYSCNVICYNKPIASILVTGPCEQIDHFIADGKSDLAHKLYGELSRPYVD